MLDSIYLRFYDPHIAGLIHECNLTCGIFNMKAENLLAFDGNMFCVI